MAANTSYHPNRYSAKYTEKKVMSMFQSRMNETRNEKKGAQQKFSKRENCRIKKKEKQK